MQDKDKSFEESESNAVDVGSTTPPTENSEIKFEQTDTSQPNDREQIVEVLPDGAIVPLTPIAPTTIAPYPDIFNEVFWFTLPYAGYAISLAGINTVNMLLLKKMGDDDGLASALLVLNFIYFTMSFSKGFITANSILISPLKAEAEQTIADGKELEGLLKYHQVGSTARAGLILTSGLSALIIGGLLLTKPILNLCRVDEDIADGVGDYFSLFVFAVPAILALTCAQQVAMGTKHSVASSVIGATFALSSIPVAYPLLLEAGWGLSALATGAIISAWLTAIGATVYLKTHPDYEQYQLFKLEFDNLSRHMKEFFYTGLLLGAKSIIEHISPLVISILIGYWKEAALASQPFSRANSFIDATMAALSLTTSVLVGKRFGTYNAALQSNNHQQARIAINEAWRVGNTAITLALLASSTASIVYFTNPDLISHLFIDSPTYIDTDSLGMVEADNFDREATFALSNDFLRVNGIGVVLSAVRHVLMGALNGYKDVAFPLAVSTVLISGIALPASAAMFLSETDEQDLSHATWLFTAKNIASLAAIGVISYRWFSQTTAKQQAIPAIELETSIELQEMGCGSDASHSSPSSSPSQLDDDTDDESAETTMGIVHSIYNTVADGSTTIMQRFGWQKTLSSNDDDRLLADEETGERDLNTINPPSSRQIPCAIL